MAEAEGPLSDADAAALFFPILADAQGILIAVSGGPDSMALMALMARWKGMSHLAAATVDHGLRSGSDAEAALVAATAEQLGITHAILPWPGRKPVTGIPNAARKARYALLTAHARSLGCSHLVTAHHADDQAETVLMRLVSGSGPGGLAAMRKIVMRDGIIHGRPFLGVAKAQLTASCEALGLAWVEDPSNNDVRFARARMRRLLPQLAAEGLTTKRLAKLAERAAETEDALQTITESIVREAGVTMTHGVVQTEWRRLETQPKEIRKRALAELLARSHADKGSGAAPSLKLERVEKLLDKIDTAARSHNRLRCSIADRIVTLQSGGCITITPAAPRRRGQIRHHS